VTGSRGFATDFSTRSQLPNLEHNTGIPLSEGEGNQFIRRRPLKRPKDWVFPWFSSRISAGIAARARADSSKEEFARRRGEESQSLYFGGLNGAGAERSQRATGHHSVEVLAENFSSDPHQIR